MERTLRSTLIVALAGALLAACPPPGSSTTESAPEPAAESASPQASGANASRSELEARRREERRIASAGPSGVPQYKYIDERGRLQLASRLEDIPERQRATAMPIEEPARRSPSAVEGEEGRAIHNVDVTIYTTSYCGYCRAAMAHFDKRGIDYLNRDVEQDEEARADYLELTGGRRGVPVIVVGDAWMQGWSQPEFDRLLASAR